MSRLSHRSFRRPVPRFRSRIVFRVPWGPCDGTFPSECFENEICAGLGDVSMRSIESAGAVSHQGV